MVPCWVRIFLLFYFFHLTTPQCNENCVNEYQSVIHDITENAKIIFEDILEKYGESEELEKLLRKINESITVAAENINDFENVNEEIIFSNDKLNMKMRESIQNLKDSEGLLEGLNLSEIAELLKNTSRAVNIVINSDFVTKEDLVKQVTDLSFWYGFLGNIDINVTDADMTNIPNSLQDDLYELELLLGTEETKDCYEKFQDELKLILQDFTKLLDLENMFNNVSLLVANSKHDKFLQTLKFPFLINLEYFFKNNVYVFLGMPFISGGEMFYHLRSAKKFDENLCKFYIAQVILSFEYIHFLGIVYRDLKPENILVDLDGYLKITDFGFCKKIDNQRTYTLCGTPEYLAPEIILSQGYNNSVDWWSLGVLMYELAAGFPPFFAKEHMKLYEKIVSGKFMCPPHFSKPLRDLLGNILQVERTKRYGILKAGAKDVKSHEWFKGVDFDSIFSKKYKPSFIPTVSGEGDTKYFENFGEIILRESSQCEYEEEFRDMSLR